MRALVFIPISFLVSTLYAQDSIPVKVRHAEPIYIDLIRDLGARKGEKEWNLGWSIAHESTLMVNTAFIEYEFAPVNRLGFEIEVPLTFYKNLVTENPENSTHRNRIEGLKLATQYTFLVNSKRQLSMAFAYIHEFRFHSFYTMQNEHVLIKGNLFNPVLIAAKRLGNHFHTLLYTGPVWKIALHNQPAEFLYQLNGSIHYMIAARHFMGIELNDEISDTHHALTVRPQVKMVLASNLAVGFLAGIPINIRESGMSFMTRIIYEPARKK